MPIKYKYATKAEIPAEHVSLYVERDGVFILDAEGAADATRLTEFRETNTKFLKLIGAPSIEEALKKLEKLKDVDPTKYRELIEEFEKIEQKKLETKGQYEQALESQKTKMAAEHKKAVDELQAKLTAATSRLQTVLIDDAVAAAAMKKGVRATALPDVKSRARGVFKLDGEEIKAFDGEAPKFGKGGEALKIDEWVETLVAEAPHLFDPSSGSGAQGGAGGGGGYSGKNPYAKGSINLTEQAKLERENPALAKQLATKASGA